MVKNYLLLTLRSIKKDKISSFIAIVGLAIGLVSSFLLYNFIDYHLDFEQFIDNDSGIKRVVYGYSDNSSGIYYNGASTLTLFDSRNVANELPSIETTARLTQLSGRVFHVNDSLNRERFSIISKNFFELIPLPFLYKEDILFNQRHSVIVDRLFAEKYFFNQDPLGQEIIMHDDMDHTLIIEAVVDIPLNSHFYKDYPQLFILEDFLLYDLQPHQNSADTSFQSEVYILPAEGFNNNAIVDDLHFFINNTLQSEDGIEKILLEDIKDIHLFSKVNSNDANNPLYMVIFMTILTIALLITSVVNSISILVANSFSRAKEFGVRKVIGGGKKNLFIQLIFESVILAFVSLILSVIIYEIVQIPFSNIVGINLEYNYTIPFTIYILVITLSVGIITGLLPANYLSSLEITSILHGNRLIKIKQVKFIFLTVQFIFAIVILIWSISVNTELYHLKNLNLGFNSNNLIIVSPKQNNLDEVEYSKLNRLREELLNIEGIESVAYTSFVPMLSKVFTKEYFTTDDQSRTYTEYYSFVDRDYFNTLSIPIVEGVVSKNSIVAMKNFNLYRNIEIGSIVNIDSENYNVSALIDNYYLESSLNGEKNYFHIVSDSDFEYQIIKIDSQINVDEIWKVWREITGIYYLDFSYIDDNIHKEIFPPLVKTIINIINILSIITLLLSLLGLFGILLHSIQHKTKEIGIRKVLGASSFSIKILFIKDISILLFFSILFGLPIGLISLQKGLIILGYNQPIHNVPFVIFLSIILLTFTTLFITLLIVMKAAIVKATDALRYE